MMRNFLLLTVFLLSGCASYEIAQTNIFADEDGAVVRIDYGHSEVDHYNTFINPKTGKEMDFHSKLVIEVTLPNGEDFTAWQCMNFSGSGTMYKTDDERWLVHLKGFSCEIGRQTRQDRTLYQQVYGGIICETPKAEDEIKAGNSKWKTLKKNARGEWR